MPFAGTGWSSLSTYFSPCQFFAQPHGGTNIMSDNYEDDDEPQFIGVPLMFGGGQVPPELQQHMDRRRLAAQDRQNTINSFWLELDSEKLAILRGVLIDCVDDPNSAAANAGVALGILMARGVCTGCGLDHTTDELAVMAAEGEEGHQ